MTASPDKRHAELHPFDAWLDETRPAWRAKNQGSVHYYAMRSAWLACESYTRSHAPRKPEPWAYAVMQPKGAEFDYLVFPDYGEAESHVADAEDEREIIPLFPPSVPSTTPQFFCSDKYRFGSSDCEKQCSACANKQDTEALLNFVEAVGDLLGVPKQPREGYTALILTKLQLLTAGASALSAIRRTCSCGAEAGEYHRTGCGYEGVFNG